MARRRCGLDGLHARADLRCEAIGRAGRTPGDGLAQDEHVGLQIVRPAVAAGAAGDGVRLVHHQQCVVLAGERAHGFEKTGLGQDHADIGEHRLGEHAGDVACGQRGPQAVEVVELDHAGVGGEVVDLTQQAGTGVGGPLRVEIDEHIIDCAVIAAVEHHDVLAPGECARPAQHEAVGIAGRGGELPHRQAEALLQQVSDFKRYRGRQHGGGAIRAVFRQGAGDGCGAVAEHGAGIAKTKVDDGVAVHVEQSGALRLVHIERHGRRRIGHPVQGHAEQKVALRLLVQPDAARMRGQEAGGLDRVKAGNAVGGKACGAHDGGRWKTRWKAAPRSIAKPASVWQAPKWPRARWAKWFYRS